MSIQGIVKRYALIIEKVTRCRYPSLSQIHRFLHAHGLEITPRTLQRDIAGISLEFGLTVKYDRRHRGYVLTRDESDNPEILLRFLAAVSHTTPIRQP
ncbi:hypothetical protein KBA41_02135 [Candidatus Ozemobacteraceae bacterium]|nr:hypothetical protein [Candidatus Ozemobacteraceae bacterium]